MRKPLRVQRPASGQPNDHHRRARSPSASTRPARSPSVWRENLESLVWSVALALVIRTFIVAPFKIPSGSMRATLIEGDRILVNKFIYRFHPPQRGDIIVFRYPEDPKRSFIKRLAAVGGETVELRQGKVVVNGQPVDGSGVFQHTYYSNQGQYGEEGQAIHVPEGSFYVLGDNPASSHDSRFWGFVPKQMVIGRAMCIFWPITRWRALR
ncbi:MAG: signal peptidase I [Candidatus Omnitrophica bacterium]|nr:signal peptidase I [Candidatus Omnitrophota bacterium]